MAVAPTTVVPGSTAEVSASGLKPHSLYSLQVCGAAARVSTDCVLGSSTSVLANNSGVFTTTLPVLTPPAPCPCVIAAFSQPYVHLTLRAPVDIQGAAFAPVIQAAPAHLVVRHVELRGAPGPPGWFGAPTERSLILTVANTGGTAVQRLSVFVAVDGTPQPLADVAGLGPGKQRTYTMGVTFPALALGHQQVSGQLTGQSAVSSLAGGAASFATSATTVPWGLTAALVVLALVLIGLLVRSTRRRARARRRRKAITGSPTGEPTEGMADDAPRRSLAEGQPAAAWVARVGEQPGRGG